MEPKSSAGAARVRPSYDRRLAAEIPAVPSLDPPTRLPPITPFSADDLALALRDVLGPLRDIHFHPSDDPRVIFWVATDAAGARLTGTAVPRMETDGANIYAGVEYGVDMEPSALARVPTRQRASR